MAVETEFHGNLGINGAASVFQPGVSVGNNASIVGTSPVAVIIFASEFGQNLTLTGNLGGVFLTNSEVGRNLSCTGNNPPPVVAGTSVGKNASGQCAP